ncbi:MAG: carboxypeptidase regulatory-like domain-containing protein [Verrucomicrobiota bacterium]
MSGAHVDPLGRRNGAVPFIVILGLVLVARNGGSAPFAGPNLQIQATNNTALVSWSGSGYWLQAAQDLSSPLDWYNAPWTVAGAGPQFSSTVPMVPNALFFRLVSSPFLPPPAGLTAQSGDSVMYVNWDAVSNAVTYNLYFASQPGVTPANYQSLANGAELQSITQPQVVLDSQTLVTGLSYYFVATAVDTNGESTYSNEGSDVFGPHGEVHGSFYTILTNGATTSEMFVPGVAVSLVNQSSGTTAAQVTTDSQGQFLAADVPEGTYQLSWSAPGFPAGALPELVVLSNDVAALPPEEIEPLAGPSAGLVFGQVTLLDGSVPVFDTNPFGTSLATTVSLTDSAGRMVRSTSANAFGQYLLTDLPVTNLTLTGTAEAATVSTNINTSVVGEANLVLTDAPPVIQSVVAWWNGQVVQHAPTGAVVQLTVTATDPQNYPLHYAWLGGPGAAGLVSVDSSNVMLTLPDTNCLAEAYVEVSDGHAGYADGQVNLNVEGQMTFDGYVQDTNGNAIANAFVSVNSTSALTDTNGSFELTLPFSQDQFLLNITAAGYTPYSEELDDSANGDTYQLVPLSPNCTIWTGAPTAFPDAYGTTVILESNSLDSVPGVPYYGPICVSIATYDPCADVPPYPAGNTAIDDLGNTNWITPQATALVMITDGSGNPLLCDTNQPPTLILPLGQSCTPLTNAPCVVPAWVWDPTNEVWQMTGLTTNQAADCASGPFMGPMLQMGLQAAAAPAGKCRVSIEVDRTINLPVVLRISSQAAPIEINEETAASLAAGVEVPVNQPITFQLLNPKEAPNVYYTNPNNANTLRPDNNKTVILKVVKTFTQDSSLTLGLSAQIPLLTANRVQSQNQFLTYNDQAITTTPANLPGGPVDVYYSAIGFPMGKTFLDWLRKDGFINPPNGTFPQNYVEDTSALYFNATDLGFARSMHMKTSPGVDGKTNIAFYVVNYTAMQDAPAEPTGDSKAVATVAMDYAATITTNAPGNYTTNRYTKFYVFGFLQGGFSATMGLRRNADLDGAGAKIVPNLCVTCHGSQAPTFKQLPAGRGWSVSNPDVKGYFIPFDLQSFTYKQGLGVQQSALRTLNAGIYQWTPLTAALSELLQGWYGRPLTSGNNNAFVTGFVPAGWNTNATQQALYTGVVGISCRGCHTERPSYPFNTFGSLNASSATAENLVCSELVMPNAQRTFTIFWGSMAANLIANGVVPNQPMLLTNQFGWAPCPAPNP